MHNALSKDKPIFDCVAQPSMRLGEAAKLALLSFDSFAGHCISLPHPVIDRRFASGGGR